MNKRKEQNGFTLIEMLIAMAILAFISVGVYQLTASTFATREKLAAETDFYNTIRVALGVVERDVIMLYTPQLKALPSGLGQIDILQPGTQPVQANGEIFDPGVASAYWGPKLNKFNIRPSRFVGEPDSMHFLSNSHVRLYKDSSESEFAKIKYAIEDDLSAKEEKTHAKKALIRYEDTDVFNYDDRKSETEVRYTLLHDVKSLKIEYLDGKNDKWFNRWDTDGRDTKNQFPALIKFTIEVSQPPPLITENTLSVVQVYKPELAL